ncbi:MAG: UDP-N-acetylglucosamine 1-carboxyvinyltransferase [Opitutales bacterium]|nr:UDP-N-acetylglucosamine 1-carboxyvinyltransferase [Opitutales bacterium]
MDVLRIRGGKALHGEITVGGAKNACLPLLAATLLTDEPCILRNVPDLSDSRFMIEILRHQGATVEALGNNAWRISAGSLQAKTPYELVRKMRASICVMGALVGRLRRAEIPLPGGCVIGQRPIDLHIKGLKKLGCVIENHAGMMHIDAAALRGDYVFLGGRYGSTVTGTANILMAAVLAPGITQIDCAACEPEVQDLCRMLVKMGAKITGIGSPMIRIEGVEKLHGCEYSVIPDRIEAGTFLLCGAITRGDVTVHGAVSEHLGAFLDKMDEAGIPFETLSPDTIRVRGDRIKELRPIDIVTLPHPGFPTDLQAQFSALLALTPGLSIITERIYPNRFMHVPELLRMGADIAIEGPSAIIKGVPALSGAPVMASDLRASAALVLAGLAASGETWVQRIYHLDRGYEKFEVQLARLGADIQRLNHTDMPSEFLGD